MRSAFRSLVLAGLVISAQSAVGEEIKASKIEIAPGVSLRERPLAKRHDECQNCHMAKNFQKIPDKKKTQLEHNRSEVRHGGKVISCNFCHDRNNHNFLRSSLRTPTSFANTSGVCRQCHPDIYRGWSEGLHGKRVGGWNLRKTQLHCIDCHNPHNVTFQVMKAAAKPSAPRFGIPKSERAHGD